MEKATKISSSVFSWADEVEREEQEVEQKAGRGAYVQENPSRKPNPFGDARPREVVLQEKGVDWRKIDHELDHHSNLRKDKKLKENISMTTASISRQHHISLETRNARSACLEQQKQNPSALVPPLKYPPKNIMALMGQIRRGRSDRSDAGFDRNYQNGYLYHSGTDQKLEHMNSNSSTADFRAHESMRDWPVDARHHNLNMQRLYPTIETIHERHDLESKFKRKWYEERLVDAATSGRRQVHVDLNMERTNFATNYEDGEEYGWERVEDAIGRRKFVQDERFFALSEELQANGRRHVPVNHNIERTTLGKHYEDGEDHYWEYIEDGIGRRNYDQELMSTPVDPHGWRLAQDGGRHTLRDAGGHPTGPVMNRVAAAMKAGYNVSIEGGRCGNNYNKKKSKKLSSSKPCPSHHRRQRKQSRK